MPSAIRRLELLLFLRKTFFTVHTTSTAGTSRNLGSHLISVYDILVASGCDSDICTAGALHSIYGTGVFKKITILPSTENRAEIRSRFGVRAERLAFLFHSCARKIPNGIETGVLFDRSKRYQLPGVTVEEIQALRLIEAANCLDQDTEASLAKRLPNVYRTWVSQKQLKNHSTASQLVHSDCCSAISCLPVAGGNLVRGLRLRVFPYTADRRIEYAESDSKGYDIYLPLTDVLEYETSFLPLTCLLDSLAVAKLKSISALPAGLEINAKHGKMRSEGSNLLDNRGEGVSSNGSAVENPALPARKQLTVFTLRGEAVMGMPWSPLWMLTRYLPYTCGARKYDRCFARNTALEIDVKRIHGDSAAAVRMYGRLSNISRSVGQPRLGPPSLSLSSIVDSACCDSTLPGSSVGRVIDSMMSYGYAVISVEDAAAATIARAYDSLLLFHNSITLKEKKQTFERFDGDRYVGWTRDSAREWLQMRVAREQGQTIPLLWPEGFPVEHRENLAAAVELLTTVTERLFEEIGVQLKLGSRTYLRNLCTGGDKGGSSVGSSVCRQFVYLDQRPPSQRPVPAPAPAGGLEPVRAAPVYPRSSSGSHADMGLLTLSPCSTIPALNLLNPLSHDVMYPEQGLGPNEWVLFAGETLSFLTAGALQAPIHSVPQVDRWQLTRDRGSEGANAFRPPPLRRSMPLFLRADPEMHLLPLRDLPSESTLTDVPHIQEKFPVRPSKPEKLPLLPSKLEIPPALQAVDAEPTASDSEGGSEHKETSFVDETSPTAGTSSEPLLDCFEEKFEDISLVDVSAGSSSMNAVEGGVEEEGKDSNRLFLSPHAMTCRVFTETHSIGLRPWRLGKGGGDF